MNETVDTVACVACGEEVPLDDVLHNENGDPFCDTCYNEHYTSCCNCDSEVLSEDALHNDNSDCYCASCYADRYTSCENCNNEVHRSDAYVAGGSHYCEECYFELYTDCTECGRTLYREDACCNDNGDYYCDRCLPSAGEWEALPFRSDGKTDEIRSNRKYGVELETAKCDDYDDLNGCTVFGCKDDGSITGKEFVSPILNGDAGLNAIRAFCAQANRMDFTVDKNCGYHAHFDVSKESTEALKSICYAYYRTAEVWRSFVPKSRRSNHYCGGTSWSLYDLYRGVGSDGFLCWASIQDRYSWFNVRAYLTHRTFEIRLHSATLDGNKVCNWIKAHARFIDFVKDKTIDELREIFAENHFRVLDEIWDEADLTYYYAQRAETFSNNCVEEMTEAA